MTDQTTRIPPQNLSAEQCVVGSMLLDPAQIPEIMSTLTDAMYYREANAIIHRAILLLHGNGVAVDIETVSNHLDATGELDKAGGVSYMATCVANVPTPKNARAYAKIVWDKHLLRETIKRAATAITDIYEHQESETPAIEQATAAGKYILDLAGADPFDAGKTTRQLLRDMIAGLKEIGETGKHHGVKTGFGTLDKLLGGGWQGGRLYLLCGEAKEGKTSAALQFGTEAEAQGRRVLYYSMEMTEPELVQRVIVQRGRIDPEFFQTYKGDAATHTAFKSVVESLWKSGWIFRGGAGMTTLRLMGTLRTLIINHGINFLIVENAQLIQPEKDESKVLAVSALSANLKALAKEYMIPVMLLSQLNDAGEEKWARALKEDSDWVGKLRRKDKAPGDYHDTDLLITANRSGPLGRVALCFEDRITSFYERASQSHGDD